MRLVGAVGAVRSRPAPWAESRDELQTIVSNNRWTAVNDDGDVLAMGASL